MNGEPICGHGRTVSSRSVGVEEEFLLVEPGTGRPKAVAGTVLQAAGQAAGSDLDAELQQQQLETNSRPCQSLDDLHRELRRCRAGAATAAGRAGAQLAALGTSPVPVEPTPVRPGVLYVGHCDGYVIDESRSRDYLPFLRATGVVADPQGAPLFCLFESRK